MVTNEASPPPEDNRQQFGARRALRTLLKEGFFDSERSPTEARVHWEQVVGTKLNCRHVCIAIKTEFDSGNLSRATKIKQGLTYVISDSCRIQHNQRES